MKKMKKILVFCLCLAMLLALVGCGKSEYVKNAEALISAIGEVTADSGEAIAAAQKAFDALTDKDKEQVENAELLPAAQEALAEALEEKAADEVEALISAIGEVTADSGEAIDAAQKAFDALDGKIKARVDNAELLPAAQDALTEALAAKAAAELETLRQSFIGSWQAESDQTALLVESVDSSLDDDRITFRDYLDSFIVSVVIEFKDDNSYRIYGDRAAGEATFTTLKASVVRFYDDYLLIALCDAITENNMGSASSWSEVEKIIGADKNTIISSSLGMTLEQFVDQLFGEEALDDMLSSMSREGLFRVEPGKLHLSSAAGAEPTDGDYESFTLEGDTLTLTDFSGTSLLEDVVYPMVFQRVG